MAAALRRTWTWIRGLPWWRFAAGGVAGVAVLFLTYVLRLFGLGVFLPGVAVDFAVGLIPGSVEAGFISAMGGGAKILALVVAVVLILAAYGVGGMLFRRVERLLGRRRWLVLAACSLGTAAVVLFAVLPLIGGGFAGSDTTVGAGFAAFSQLLGGWLYASVLDYFLVDVAAKHPEGFNPTRRDVLKWMVASAVVAGLTLYGLALTAPKVARLAFASVAQMVSKEVTPTGEFYTVTKNVVDPSVDAGAWNLVVDGLVAAPRTYAYADLAAMAAVDEAATLECVSNEVGGNLISTANWSGIRLADLIGASIPDGSASWALFTCSDGYTVAIPLAKAQESSTLLALKMNGASLLGAHGYPARVLVPGKYGMFSAKWVTRITLVDHEILGYWQQRGWTDQGDIRATAIVATPAADSVVSGLVTIGGIAFAGTRGVWKVEVSTDGGATWSPARLRTPPLSALSWVLWTFDWIPPGGGSYRVLARMVDGSGVSQEAERNPPFSEGSSGYDAITLLVR